MGVLLELHAVGLICGTSCIGTRDFGLRTKGGVKCLTELAPVLYDFNNDPINISPIQSAALKRVNLSVYNPT